MRQQEIVAIIGGMALVFLLGGIVNVFGHAYGWPPYLQLAIGGPPSGWIMRRIGYRLQDRNSSCR